MQQKKVRNDKKHSKVTMDIVTSRATCSVFFCTKSAGTHPITKNKKGTYQYSLFTAGTAENAPCPSIYRFKTTVYIVPHTDNTVGIKKNQQRRSAFPEVSIYNIHLTFHCQCRTTAHTSNV